LHLHYFVRDLCCFIVRDVVLLPDRRHK
jgi:hypothetical protein